MKPVNRYKTKNQAENETARNKHPGENIFSIARLAKKLLRGCMIYCYDILTFFFTFPDSPNYRELISFSASKIKIG